MNTAHLATAKIIWSTKVDEIDGMSPTIEVFTARAEGVGKRTVVVPKLQHGSKRAVVDVTVHSRPEVDVVLTNDLTCALGMYVSDCLPIVCYDATMHSLALVHGGWRSLLQNLLPLAIQDMQLQFGSKVKDIQVWIGPSLQACCNLMQNTQVHGQFTEWDQYLVEKPDGMHLDLQKASIDQCKQEGIAASQIENTGICTYHNRDVYYSHRREMNEHGENHKKSQMSVVVWMEQ